MDVIKFNTKLDIKSALYQSCQSGYYNTHYKSLLCLLKHIKNVGTKIYNIDINEFDSDGNTLLFNIC